MKNQPHSGSGVDVEILPFDKMPQMIAISIGSIMFTKRIGWQMTSALFTGCLIGGIMSFSNLYVGLKIGWGLGSLYYRKAVAFAFLNRRKKLDL